MAKKKTEKKEDNKFDLKKELDAYPCPEWYKKAFVATVDTSKINSKSDLDKAIQKYGEMK